jgi:myosin protein heavy chain
VQDIEALQRQVEELQAANDKLDKSKKKLQAELEDSNIDLEAQRAKVLELEKKQRNFDKVLAEEKVRRCVKIELILYVRCMLVN